MTNVPVEVSFSPQAVGNRMRKIVFNVEDDTDTTLSAVLTGIGVVPGLGTKDLDFGSTILSDPEVKKTVDFELIRNYPSSVTGDFRDTVWIDGFDFVSDDDGIGNKDFRYDPPNGGSFPIVLIPNENDKVTITGYFSARAVGARNASIRARTRDGVDTTSTWVGLGVGQNSGASVTATPGPTLCLGETDSIFVTIMSNGDVPLTVSDISLDDPNGEFVLDNPPSTPMTIAAGDSRRLTVLFTPQQKGARTATLSVTTDDPDNPKIDVTLTGEGSQIEIPGVIQLTGTDPVSGHAVLGEYLTATLVTSAPLDPVGASSYQVTISYNPSTLIAPFSASDITLNPALHPTGSQAVIDPASTAGTLIIDVTSPQPLTGTGGLLSTRFGVAFDTTFTRELSANVQFTSGSSCATMDIAAGKIDVTRVCGLHLRLIELVPGAKYALDGAMPNPVNKGGGEIQYSLGLDGPTRVVLYDASGNYVSTLVDQYQQPGVYRVGFDATTLSSGLYYCVLESGDYRETKPLMIAK